MSYYLVQTKEDDDRPEETAGWIAKSLAVTLHGEVAARTWMVNLSIPEVIDRPDAWHRYNKKGNPVEPDEPVEPEEGQVVV
jgi:hypothetical protein